MTRMPSWRLDQTAPTVPSAEPGSTAPTGQPADHAEAAPTAFASLHYLRSALRRRTRTWLGLAVAGLVVGAGYAVAVPVTPVATVVLKLSHPDGQDPSSAMQTDLNLLRTNVVTDRAADRLGLQPDELSADVSAMILTPDLLRVRVTGPSAKAAVQRAAVVADVFLDRRGETLRLESDSWVASYQSQMDDLKKQVAAFQQQYDALSRGNTSSQEQATSVLQQRDSAQQQVTDLQGKIDDTNQSIGAVIDGSEPVDPAAILPVSAPKRTALSAVSGLVAGGVIGAGLVLLQALTTTRLRRREEVALALAAPVLCAAGGATRWPWGSPAYGVPALARGVVDTLARRNSDRLLLLLCLAGDRRAERRLGRVAETAATALAGAGKRVLVVDLTRRGQLGRLSSAGAGGGVRVVRPSGLLARGPLDPGLAGGETAPEGWESADVVLTVGHLGLDAGVDELASWGERALLLVRAGRASAERLRSSAELLQVAGVELVGALLDGTDATDDSMGRPDVAGAGARHVASGPLTEPQTEPQTARTSQPTHEQTTEREPAAVEAT